MGFSEITYGASKKYILDLLDGIGAIKGSPCTIKSTVKDEIGKFTTITFEWEGTSGTKKTTSIKVYDGINGKEGKDGKNGNGIKNAVINTDNELIITLDDGTILPSMKLNVKDGVDGKNGKGVTSISKLSSQGNIDTYRIEYSDNSIFDYTVTNATVVTKLSELVNDGVFITETVNNLVNYYTKKEVYTKDEITDLLRKIGVGLGVEVVEQLPTQDISLMTIYLIKNDPSNPECSTYNQFMYISGDWANLGSTSIDLSGFYSKTEIDTKLDNYVLSTVLTTTLADYMKKTDLAKVATSNNYNDLDNLPTIPTVTNDLTDELKKKYDDASENAKHGNKDELDKIGENADGNLTYDGKSITVDLSDCLKKTDVVDNLSSTDTEKSLSANQGKILKEEIDELFQSASNGKKLIATAITGKGITTSDTDTYQTMATNIDNISSGETDLNSTTATTDDVISGMTFGNADGIVTGTMPNYSDNVYETTVGTQGDYFIIKNPKGYFSANGIKVKQDSYKSEYKLYKYGCEYGNLTTPINTAVGSSVEFDGKWHFIGGIRNSSHFVFDGETFTQLNDLPVEIYGSVCLVYNRNIHLFGGTIVSSVCSNCHYVYDETKDTWSESTSMPIALSSHSGCVYKDKVHLLGGTATSSTMSNASATHITFDGSTWTTLNNIPSKLYYENSIYYNNKINLFGGHNNVSKGYVKKHYTYNDDDTWTTLDDCPTSFSGCACLEFNNVIHVLGGNNSSSAVNYHYSYDGNSWTNWDDMQYSVRKPYFASINNRIWILSGGNYALSSFYNYVQEIFPLYKLKE